jgi:hypothetical protein
MNENNNKTTQKLLEMVGKLIAWSKQYVNLQFLVKLMNTKSLLEHEDLLSLYLQLSFHAERHF